MILTRLVQLNLHTTSFRRRYVVYFHLMKHRRELFALEKYEHEMNKHTHTHFRERNEHKKRKKREKTNQ